VIGAISSNPNQFACTINSEAIAVRVVLQKSREGAPTADKAGDNMAQTHYTTKTKRRPKNSNRKDPSAATMAALRQLEAAAKK
jgi:hypothetical protein